MKICVIVRGHCVREDNPHRKYVDSLMCWPNWKTTFCNMDFAFITYPSSIMYEEYYHMIKHPLYWLA